MFSKFSVRKPYTVLVAVVMIITLAIVSFTNMHTDMFPKMDFPYAIVMTTYIGASPEEVESSVTKPIEQAMASVSNIKNITSSSSENSSMVMLEFNQSTNMDSVSLEIRESLDQITANWDDKIGKPTIMKINPDMMPVMVAGIDYKNKNSVEVTNTADEKVIPELENIEGVASVTTSGKVTEKVEVLIRQEKIDKMNEKVQDAIDGKMEKAEKKINKGQNKLSDGKNTLKEQQEKAADQMAKGDTQLNTATDKLSEGLKKIDSQISQIKKQKTTLESTEKQIKSGLTTLNAKKKEVSSSISKLKTQKSSLDTIQISITRLDSEISSLEKQIEAAGESATDEMKAQLTEKKNSLQVEEKKLTAMGMSRAQLSSQVASLASALTTAQAGLTEIDKQITTLNASMTKVTKGKAQIDAGLTKMNQAKTKMKNGQVSTKDALEALAKQKILASIKLSVAEAQISSGESKLKEAKTQLKEAKKTTKDSTNLNTIITSEMVQGILTAENFEMPAGYVTENDVDYLVKVGDKVDKTKDLENLVVADMNLDGLDPIKLSDVADVVRTNDSSEVYTKLNGRNAVCVVLEKQTGFSTGDVAKKILAKFDTLQKNDKDLTITTLMNQADYIDLVVDSVTSNLISGGILAILILLLFLRDWKPTLIVACSIPLSLATAIVLMYFSGVTLNIISLSGLALGVGMLVDNSIVVIENVYRLRKEGYSVRKAAVEGAKEVAGAIASSTMTTICVFLPIVFTEGITRQLFVDLGLTLAYSLLASLIVALTLVPAMASKMLRRTKEDNSKILRVVQNAYEKVMKPVMRFRVLVVIGAFVFMILSAIWAISRGTSFMPSMEGNEMTMSVETDKDVSFEEAAKNADEVFNRIKGIEGIESVGSMSGQMGIGSMSGGNSGKTTISTYLVLKEKRDNSTEDIKKQIEEKTKGLKGKIEVQTSTMDMSALGSSGIVINVKGKDLDKLQKITEDLKNKISKVEGLKEISNGMEDGKEEFRISIDKQKAMSHSLTVAQVFQQINAKIKEATTATTISTDTKDFDVFVKNEKDESLDKAKLKNMKIEYTDTMTQKKKKVKLSSIATFDMAKSPQQIVRDSQSRRMQVTASLKDDYNIGLVSQDVKKALKDYKAPEGYTIDYTGEDETVNDSLYQVMLMFVLGLLFMYLIMVAQFQSLLSPFIILFTIPLAFTGGFLGLAITGKDVSVIAAIGFVMLSGIIVNNGIVLVDYANQLRRRGMKKREALIESGKTRLRPILMTAMTTVLGLSTMAMGLGMGGSMVQPMAIVTIGGLIYGTVLTLFVVPCIYDLLNREKNMVEEEL